MDDEYKRGSEPLEHCVNLSGPLPLACLFFLNSKLALRNVMLLFVQGLDDETGEELIQRDDDKV